MTNNHTNLMHDVIEALETFKFAFNQRGWVSYEAMCSAHLTHLRAFVDDVPKGLEFDDNGRCYDRVSADKAAALLNAAVKKNEENHD